MNKKIIVLIILAVILLGGWHVYRDYVVTPISMVTSIIESVTKPKFKEAAEYNTGNAGYECSKPIKLQRQRELVGHLSGISVWQVFYLPVNPDEAKSFCQITSIE